VRVSIGEFLADRHAVRTVAFAERLESLAEDTTLLDPVTGELSLVGTGRTVSLTGRVRTVVHLVCGACLQPFPQPLEFAIHEEFGTVRAPASQAGAARAEAALGEEDFVVAIGPDEVIDLSEVVRQHLLLALPIAPRCQEGCRGLCPSCGADLNAGPCACPQDRVDPRLEALRQWPRNHGERPAAERK
jgi:uncharacterized protein